MISIKHVLTYLVLQIFAQKNAFDHESSFTGNKITSEGLALGMH